MGIEKWYNGGIITYFHIHCEALEIRLRVVKSKTSPDHYVAGFIYQSSHFVLLELRSWDDNCVLLSMYSSDVCTYLLIFCLCILLRISSYSIIYLDISFCFTFYNSVDTIFLI